VHLQDRSLRFGPNRHGSRVEAADTSLVEIRCIIGATRERREQAPDAVFLEALFDVFFRRRP